ncbi:MAG TPA: D-glucuronyl C5-epimerase family protein [Candidatus Deferrimicrobium sp.]|nr:D-glucuronyl C5-epimerase family protein [Candidatus Deferrimicrobium sp.]
MVRFGERIASVLEYVGVRSTHYYHSGERISFSPSDPLAFYLDSSPRASYSGPYDPRGIPLYTSKGKTDYLPVLICAWALGHVELYRQTKRDEHRARFISACEWLLANLDSAGVWLVNHPMPKFDLHRPFPSAIVQGVGLSCLCRAVWLTGDDRYLRAATAALAPFRKTADNGGIMTRTDGYVFYEEYPSVPHRHVLNGFILSLWGLFDLIRLNDHAEAKHLYEDGLRTLVAWLPRFDLGHWSLYHVGGDLKNPATVHYHRLHIAQLRIMHLVTGLSVFSEYAERWQAYSSRRWNALRTFPAKLRWTLS